MASHEKERGKGARPRVGTMHPEVGRGFAGEDPGSGAFGAERFRHDDREHGRVDRHGDASRGGSVVTKSGRHKSHGERRSDERIREEAYAALANAPDLELSDVKVEVDAGLVTLTGEVDEIVGAAAAASLVERVDGVGGVRNELRLRPIASGESSSRNDQRTRSGDVLPEDGQGFAGGQPMGRIARGGLGGPGYGRGSGGGVPTSGGTKLAGDEGLDAGVHGMSPIGVASNPHGEGGPGSAGGNQHVTAGAFGQGRSPGKSEKRARKASGPRERKRS